MSNVAVLGASNNPEKYSNLAIQLLLEKGHRVFPIHPSLKEIDRLKVYSSLSEIQQPVHTITLYVSKEISSKIAKDILSKSPQRILFNPGAENPELLEAAQANGIKCLEACTLTMLRTGQF